MRTEVLVTLTLVSCCAAFSSLGYWQMTRAEEKRLIEAQLDASYAAAPSQLGAGSTPFSRVRAQGRFNSEIQFLVGNRVFDGQPGYEVVQAFDVESGLRVLVDRGWVGMTDARTEPDVPLAPQERVEAIGLLLPDFGAGVTFDRHGAGEPAKSWPMRIQTLDLETMTAMAEANIPHMLKLRNGEPGALALRAFELPMGAERHTAYAVQWFGLALAAVIIWIVLARKYFSRRTRSDD